MKNNVFRTKHRYIVIFFHRIVSAQAHNYKMEDGFTLQDIPKPFVVDFGDIEHARLHSGFFFFVGQLNAACGFTVALLVHAPHIGVED